MHPKRTCRVVAIAALCLTLCACFEEPIRQHLHLHLTDGAVVVTWTDEVAPRSRSRGNAAVARRMENHRNELANGLTDATGWFERLDAAADRYAIERVDGAVRAARWTAVVTDRRALESFLTEIGLTTTLQRVRSGAELYLQPDVSSGATRAERRLLDQLLEEWSVELADYLGATHDLYAYLETAPDRAAACFVNLFENDEVSADWPVSEREAELLKTVAESIDDVIAALVEIDDQPHSPNELSRRVLDRFPYRLTVSADGELLVSDGWIDGPLGVERPPVSLWQALIDLEGRWIEPGLATAMVSPGPENEQPTPDPFDFARGARWTAPPPAPHEIADAITTALQRSESLVVRWAGRPPGSVEIEDPGALLGIGPT